MFRHAAGTKRFVHFLDCDGTKTALNKKLCQLVLPHHKGDVYLQGRGKGAVCLCVVYHAALKNFDSDVSQSKLAEPVLREVQLFQGHELQIQHLPPEGY